MSNPTNQDPQLPVDPQLHELEEKLCALAVSFRGARTQSERATFVAEYQTALRKLLNLGWREFLIFECELPHEYLPTEYIEFVEEMRQARLDRGEPQKN